MQRWKGILGVAVVRVIFAGGVRLGFTVRHWQKSSLYAPDARLFKGDGKPETFRGFTVPIGFFNFCLVHSRTRPDADTSARITDHAWTIEELLTATI